MSGLAAEVTKMADQVKSSGQAVSDGTATANWKGTAAEQFRAHAQTRSKDFRNCVSLLDEAASALRALAARVE
ncbi:MAG: WXG100 family type VII secretion target [Nocardiopsaceae bacterium]|nr:WXG100 family type VII secretion target [Nocardiopsaceae bacterium]